MPWIRSAAIIALAFPAAVTLAQQGPAERLQLGQRDHSRPVPAKSEIIAAWQKRQGAINTFRFAWTEEQTHPKGWLSNPRYAERERSAIRARPSSFDRSDGCATSTSASTRATS